MWLEVGLEKFRFWVISCGGHPGLIGTCLRAENDVLHIFDDGRARAVGFARLGFGAITFQFT